MNMQERIEFVANEIFQDGIEEALFHFVNMDAFENFIDRYIVNRNSDVDSIEYIESRTRKGWDEYLQDLDKEIQNDYADLPYN